MMTTFYDEPGGGSGKPGKLDVAPGLPTGPMITETDDDDTWTRFFNFPYRMTATGFAKAFGANNKGFPLLSRDPQGLGGYYIGSSKPQHVGGGLVDFTIRYALLPPKRNLAESKNHTYQIAIQFDGANPTIVEFTDTVTAAIVKTYYATYNPNSIGLYICRKAVNVGGTINIIGSLGNPPYSNYVLGENETLKLWKGSIWEKTSIYVPIQFPVVGGGGGGGGSIDFSGGGGFPKIST